MVSVGFRCDLNSSNLSHIIDCIVHMREGFFSAGREGHDALAGLVLDVPSIRAPGSLVLSTVAVVTRD